jgi:hypothetical protein
MHAIDHPPPPPPAWPAALAVLREAGAEQADPVRWRFLEALARRAGATQGRARALLDARLDALVGEFAMRCGPDARGTRTDSTGPGPDADPVASIGTRAHPGRGPGPLAMLTAALGAAQTGPAAEVAPRPAIDRPPPPAAELKASRLFGHGWARMAAEVALQRARATLPAQTGPLNSERLVLAALQRLQALSPDHLARLLAEVEALRWLARAEAAEPAAAPAPGHARISPRPRPRRSAAAAGR